MFHTIFVYGSLRKNFHNHSYIENSEYLGTSNLENFQLYKLCSSYPTAIKSYNPDDKIVIEIYKVNDDVLKSLDRLEGHPNSNFFYRNEEYCNDFSMKGWIYYCSDEETQYIKSKKGHTLIESGDWANYS